MSVVVAAARLRAHRPEHHADDEAQRPPFAPTAAGECGACAAAAEAPGRLDRFGVLDLDQFVIFGRRLMVRRLFPCRGRRSALFPQPWCQMLPRREPCRGQVQSVCVTHETLQTAKRAS